MNEFDFLSRMPLGQYVPSDSVIHKLDPRAKVFLFVILIIALTFGQTLTAMLLGLVYLVVLILLSKIGPKFAFKSILASLPFLLLFAVIQMFFYSSSKSPDIIASFWIFHITVKGLTAGGILLLRFSALILALSLTTFCTSSSEFIQGMQGLLSPFNKIGLKTMDLVMVMQITLRFIPLLAQTAERIAKNQASRGADWEAKKGNFFNRIRQLLPLIVPLFVISLRRAENLALAMDARAYGYLDRRTSIYELRYSVSDIVFTLINSIVSLAIILL